jgi:hypothetical protein
VLGGEDDEVAVGGAEGFGFGVERVARCDEGGEVRVAPARAGEAACAGAGETKEGGEGAGGVFLD